MIINYEAARLKKVLAGLIKWSGRGRTYLAIDKSIQIKTYDSTQTKALHDLAAWSPYTNELMHVRYVRLLTGRPQTQGPHDLWGQLHAIGLFPGRSYFHFRGIYCVMGGWKNKQVIQAKNTEQLAKIMAPVVFQAKKADWLPGLPRKT